MDQVSGARRARLPSFIFLSLAVAGIALAAYLGIALERAQDQILQLQQSLSQPPEAPPADGPGAGTEDLRLGPVPKQEAPEPDPGPEDPGPERPAYQDLYPELYAQPHQWNSLYEKKVAYLTFDDGPSARTPEVLEILDRYGIKGTFFAVGQDTEQARQWMRDIVAAGHTLGSTATPTTMRRSTALWRHIWTTSPRCTT